MSLQNIDMSREMVNISGTCYELVTCPDGVRILAAGLLCGLVVGFFIAMVIFYHPWKDNPVSDVENQDDTLDEDIPEDD